LASAIFSWLRREHEKRREIFPHGRNREGKSSKGFDRRGSGIYTGGMEVRFTPEEEARLAKLATHEGVHPEELVKDDALRLLEDESRFRAGVRKGREQANRGEFVEEEEMDARVKRMFER
jgi:predicted transcriptional regulator